MNSPIKSPNSLQVFLRLPSFTTKTLTLTPNQTISDLKSTLFPQNDAVFLSFNGKPLPDNLTIFTLSLRPFSTITAHLRAVGGGGDGGATGAESRDCYLNMYAEKKPDSVDPNEKRVSKWTTCALSYEPLKPPCVIDRLGNVFNKETLVKALITKSLPDGFRHIRGLKDMITIRLSDSNSNSGTNSDSVRFQCPITGLEFNGNYKFVALTKCGHVISVKALKEIKSTSCLVCHTEFDDSYPDKIVINGSDEEVAAMREFVKAKPSKKKKKDDGNGNGNGNGGGKRFKAVDAAPAHANKEVYASIFTSSRKSEFKETYSCRSLPLGRN